MATNDKNNNFPKYMLHPSGAVLPIPVNPITGAIRVEVVSAVGTVIAPTGNEIAQVDANMNKSEMMVMPTGEIVNVRMGPVLKRLRIEFK